MGNHILTGNLSIETIRDQFIDALCKNITKRFPVDDSNLLSSFCALGLKGLRHAPEEEVDNWGNDHIDNLCDHYGNARKAKPRKNYQEDPIEAAPVIDSEVTKDEW